MFNKNELDFLELLTVEFVEVIKKQKVTFHSEQEAQQFIEKYLKEVREDMLKRQDGFKTLRQTHPNCFKEIVNSLARITYEQIYVRGNNG